MVEGINRVYQHLKPSRRNPQGGRLSKEMPVDVVERRPDRPADATGRPGSGVQYLADGTKELVRQEVRGDRIRTLAKANPKYAKKK